MSSSAENRRLVHVSRTSPERAHRESVPDEARLSHYIDILTEQRWLVVSITIASLVVGFSVAVLSTPVYRSNLLIQVEDSAPDARRFLGESSNLFDVKASSSGEIQILRSRLVMGNAVDATKVYIDAKPRYVPLIGAWLARRATGLSSPGLFGVGGFVSGTEAIEIARFDVPPSMEDTAPFTITALADGRYQLAQERLLDPLIGEVGKPLIYAIDGSQIHLVVTRLAGRPGAKFSVERASRLATIEELQKRVQLTEPGKQSNVINVSLEDTDRARLTGVLNQIGAQYLQQNVERKAAEAQKTLDFLDGQLPEFKRQLEASEDAYTRFRNKNGTIAFDEEARGVLSQTVELQSKLLEAQQRRRELVQLYADSNPRVRTVDAQIAAIQREIDSLNGRVARMPLQQQDALRLERDVRVSGELYKTLLNNALQLRLVKEGKIGNVRLLDAAVVPKLPVRPQRSLILALALVLGVSAGAAFAILRSKLRGGIRDAQEIEAHTGLSVYAVLPLTKEQTALEHRIASNAKGIQPLALAQPDNPTIESLRSLRIALQFAMLEAGNNRLLITGATSGVGKSFISVNFSAVMASAGKRVLLIDADLRRGELHRQFGVVRENGLSEVLTGLLSVEQAIRPVLPAMDLLTTGKLASNPADMIMSERFSHLLTGLSDRYDLVLIDAPALLAAADAVAAALCAGTVLLVARADETRLGDLDESIKRLANAGKFVNGVLFNALDTSRPHYGTHGYRYGAYAATTVP